MVALGKNQKKILKLLSKYRSFKSIKEINKLNNYKIKKASLTSSLYGLYGKGLLLRRRNIREVEYKISDTGRKVLQNPSAKVEPRRVCIAGTIRQSKGAKSLPKTRRIKLNPHRASGGRKSWYKLLQNIDKSKKYGYSFKGPWLPLNQEIDVPIGGIIIEGRQYGSVKHPEQEYIAKRITRSGKLTTIARGGKSDFLTFRDKIYKELKK